MEVRAIKATTVHTLLIIIMQQESQFDICLRVHVNSTHSM